MFGSVDLTDISTIFEAATVIIKTALPYLTEFVLPFLVSLS